MEEKSELEKALELAKANGYYIVHPASFAGKAYIQEISELLEKGGYRLDKAKAVRHESGEWTGRISLSVFVSAKKDNLNKM